MSVRLVLLVIEEGCVHSFKNEIRTMGRILWDISQEFRELFCSDVYRLDFDGFWWSEAQLQDDDRYLILLFSPLISSRLLARHLRCMSLSYAGSAVLKDSLQDF